MSINELVRSTHSKRGYTNEWRHNLPLVIRTSLICSLTTACSQLKSNPRSTGSSQESIAVDSPISAPNQIGGTVNLNQAQTISERKSLIEIMVELDKSLSTDSSKIPSFNQQQAKDLSVLIVARGGQRRSGRYHRN